jgi:hypothetical protein
MEKNVAIGLGALLVLGAVGLIFVGSGSTAPVAETPSQAAAAQEGVEVEAPATTEGDGLFEGSLATLITRGGTFECSFDEVINGAQSAGVVYVSGDKVRLNFSAREESASEPIRGAMIQKDGQLYMWSDAMPQGVQMAVAAGDTVSQAPMSGAMFDQNATMQYSCKSWTPNAAWFEVPPTIEFMTL